MVTLLTLIIRFLFLYVGRTKVTAAGPEDAGG